MQTQWKQKDISLRYRLGELPLYTAKLSVLVHDTPLAELLNAATSQDQPLRMPDETDGTLLRSWPEQHLDTAAQAKSRVCYVRQRYDRFFVDLTGTFEQYLQKFSSKTRSTLKRKVRKFTEFSGGEIDWRAYEHSDQIDAFCDLAETVSIKTYQENTLNLGMPRGADWRNELKSLASKDSFRGYVLFHQNQPISFLCCPADAGVLHYQFLGYDPDFSQHSPGTVLQFVVFERLFMEQQFKWFDFTEGDGPQKKLFATGSVRCADVFYLRKTWRNWMLVQTHRTIQWLGQAVGSVAESCGLKRALRKWIRRL